MTKIDITFNVYTDANGGDPDRTSPTLRSYHKILWSKRLPGGKYFELTDRMGGFYLYHNSSLGEFFLGSDAITHPYKNHKRKTWLTQQIPNDVQELFEAGSTIGGYTIFPSNRLEGKNTVNQERGVNKLIDDRFDLTLECLRLFYKGEKSPLYETFNRHKDFFYLFESFKGYIDFFFLNDLIDENENIRFYLPFDEFKTRPIFRGVEDYMIYKKRVMEFILARNTRIKNYVEGNLAFHYNKS